MYLKLHPYMYIFINTMQTILSDGVCILLCFWMSFRHSNSNFNVYKTKLNQSLVFTKLLAPMHLLGWYVTWNLSRLFRLRSRSIKLISEFSTHMKLAKIKSKWTTVMIWTTIERFPQSCFTFASFNVLNNHIMFYSMVFVYAEVNI